MENSIYIYIGSKLRQIRKSRNLSQEDVAEALNISFQQVQKYEKGLSKINCGNLYKISKLMKIHPGLFFDCFEDQNEDQDEDLSKEYPHIAQKRISSNTVNVDIHGIDMLKFFFLIDKIENKKIRENIRQSFCTLIHAIIMLSK